MLEGGLKESQGFTCHEQEWKKLYAREFSIEVPFYDQLVSNHNSNTTGNIKDTEGNCKKIAERHLAKEMPNKRTREKNWQDWRDTVQKNRGMSTGRKRRNKLCELEERIWWIMALERKSQMRERAMAGSWVTEDRDSESPKNVRRGLNWREQRLVKKLGLNH